MCKMEKSTTLCKSVKLRLEFSDSYQQKYSDETLVEMNIVKSDKNTDKINYT